MALAVVEFQAFLTGLADELGRRIERLGGRLARLTQPELLAFVTDAYPELATPYLAASADATAVWYDEQPAPPSADRFVAEPAEPSPVEQLAANARWAMLQSNPVRALQGSSTRAVFDASRDTVFANAAREKVLWARHAAPTACGFCRMLATRGAVYRSQARALRAHDHCHCLAVPDRDGSYQPPDYVEQWEKDYEAARNGGARTPAEIANAMDKAKPKPVTPTPVPVPKPVATSPIKPAASADGLEGAIALLSKQTRRLDLSETLKTQTVPKGWEALDELPDWVNKLGVLAPKVQPEKLAHALRMPGTNHIMTSDVPLTDRQLTSFMAEYEKAIAAIGYKIPEGVAMHLPRGSFPRRAHGYTLGFQGEKATRVFYMRPSLAKQTAAAEAKAQAAEASYREKKGNGWSMPAHSISSRAYTMVHEMGHILDNINSHTGGRMTAAMGGGGFNFWKTVKSELSVYGQSETVEGYAEAAAQYFLGGKDSSAVARKYARVYGW